MCSSGSLTHTWPLRHMRVTHKLYDCTDCCWSVTLRGLSNVADLKREIEIYRFPWSWLFFFFTVTYSHLIDRRVSSLPPSFTRWPCCWTSLIRHLVLPQMAYGSENQTFTGIYSLHSLHKDPHSASCKPFTSAKSLYLSHILLSSQLWVCGSAFCTAPSHCAQHSSA